MNTIRWIALVLAFALLAGMLQAAAAEEAPAVKGICLKDGWKAREDTSHIGVQAGWEKRDRGVEIAVPGTLREYCTEGWFFNTFDGGLLDVDEGERVYLELGGVTYRSRIYLNGVFLMEHEGENERFSVDLTDVFDPAGPNLLAINARGASDAEPLDGLKYSQLPIMDPVPKIQEPVYVTVRPQLHIGDVYLIPDASDGTVTVRVTLENAGSESEETRVSARICADGAGRTLSQAEQTLTAAPGEGTLELTLRVENPLLWDLENPYLYRVEVTAGKDSWSGRTGFKTLEVDGDGYFRLNGERIFLKCTHTGLYIPGSVGTAEDLETMRKQLMYLKTCGFNAVRFLRGGALDEIFELCDQIGLLVYEEHPMSWLCTDSDRTEELFDLSVRQVLLRDRNHVSLGIFGMLNETTVKLGSKQIWQAALDELPKMRDDARNVLFLLSSARWDGNQHYASFSNPGSMAWDAWTGDEREEAEDKTRSMMNFAWMRGMGDVHFYPYLPLGAEARSTLEKYSQCERAVFLSEAGAGSIPNLISSYLYFPQENIEGGYAAYGRYGRLSGQVRQFRDFYDAYGLSRIWATPEEMLKASGAYMTEQRKLLLTWIRRCGNFSGYSMTMGFDAGFRGEGLLETDGGMKAGTAEMLEEGLADLRFCVTIAEPHLRSGDALDLEVVLSNFGVLTSRKYNIRVSVTCDAGTVWQQDVSIKPEAGEDGAFPIILPVLHETIDTAGWAGGTYRVGCEMLNGAHPTCGEVSFHVSETPKAPEGIAAAVLNVPERVKKALEEAGVSLHLWDPEQPENGTIFVGPTGLTPQKMQQLLDAANAGAHVVFLSPKAYVVGGKLLTDAFGSGAELMHYDAWLYHFDSIVLDTAATDGLMNGCILDTQYYGSVYSNDFFTNLPAPDDPAVAVLYADMDDTRTVEFATGFQLGTYRMGEGLVTLNSLSLMEGAGTPAADAIIVNLAVMGAQR